MYDMYMDEYEYEHMLNGLQMLIDQCRRFRLSISDISIDNENEEIKLHIKDSEYDLVFDDGAWSFKDKDIQVENSSASNKTSISQDIYDKLVSKKNILLEELSTHLEKKDVSGVDVIKGELLKARLKGFEEALSIILTS